MIASLTAVALNVGLKLVLYKPWGAQGLAFATAIGAWINFGILVALALRAGSMRPNAVLGKVLAASVVASLALAAVAYFGVAPAHALAMRAAPFVVETQLALLGAAGGGVYVAVFLLAAKAIGLDLSVLRGGRRRVAKPQPDEAGAAP